MSRSLFAWRPVAHAAALAALIATLPAQAQTAQEAAVASGAEAAQRQRYDLPAGPLARTLLAIGQHSGRTLSLDPALASGKQAPAIQGSYTAEQALQAALAGSGLVLTRDAQGVLGVRPAPQASALPASAAPLPEQGIGLATVTVSGKAPGSTTEGTDSYTTASSSSSTRLNLAPQETPQALTVMTRQRLEDLGTTRLSDMLEAAPGIIVTRDGLGAESDGYWSRGFEIQNYEIDGVPTAAGLNQYTQHMAMYDRVEIVRGATGLISGMGNPSATINLIRKRPTARPQTQLNVDAGSWGRRGAGLDISRPLNQDGSARARLVADYQSGDAWLERYHQDSRLLYGIAEVDLDDRTLWTVGFSYLRNDVDAPMRSGLPSRFPDGSATRLPRALNGSPNWSYNNHEQSGFFTSIERELSGGWTGKVEYAYGQDRYDSVYTYLNGTLQADGSGTSLLPVRFQGQPRQHNLDMYLTGPLKLFGREHELIAGLTLSRFEDKGPTSGSWLYDYSDSAAGRIDNLFTYDGSNPVPDFAASGRFSTKEHQYAGYLTGRFRISEPLRLILGSRQIYWGRDTASTPDTGEATTTRARENGAFIPYVGAVYDMTPQWALYASYTKIFNPQASWVRDENNATLAPMEGRGLEVGIKGRHLDGKLNSSLALFNLKQDNLAVWQAQFPGSNVYKAEQNTTSQGLEVELSGELAPGWQVSAGYANTLTTNAEGQRINTMLPRNSVKLFSSYRLGGALQGLTLGGGVNWQSEVGDATVRQASYAVVNLMARYDIDRHWSASVHLNNALDRKYFSYAGYYSHYGTPRNLMVGVKYRF
ncbi:MULTISPECIES: TonB-dependent siderophore receptor [unclassified Delftia]|uniref:TonB-dependent siderophore receptor n=1 Tax=unclassified Delftia TaxID=2613839 RepID=UPI00190111DC|nr:MULTISPECIES: TonB-dependent siderophore receptor [unclassified Delftia]MBK0111581.1 TonB-dependent siderophore receptor [Delftia sp. S65]MBK0118313.1 TonB-dependent siderophore receptor [Delftia sp. S67]MBK0129716.1 TonB-dependent siderophore receptor [Delftia sp. S66]